MQCSQSFSGWPVGGSKDEASSEGREGMQEKRATDAPPNVLHGFLSPTPPQRAAGWCGGVPRRWVSQRSCLHLHGHVPSILGVGGEGTLKTECSFHKLCF